MMWSAPARADPGLVLVDATGTVTAGRHARMTPSVTPGMQRHLSMIGILAVSRQED